MKWVNSFFHAYLKILTVILKARSESYHPIFFHSKECVLLILRLQSIFLVFRAGINDIFQLKNPLGRSYKFWLWITINEYVITATYSNEKVSLPCGEECLLSGACVCALCSCCSNCTLGCSCKMALFENKKMEQVLGLGDETYRFLYFYTKSTFDI